MKKLLLSTALLCFSCFSNATIITTTSPTSTGSVSSSVSEIGGVVIDLVGANGTSILSQLSADSLFRGKLPSNPGTLGVQTGFDSTLLSLLGGGLVEAAVRITLFDGDTSSGDFDFNANFLNINGINFGNFSDVLTDNTNSSGTVSISNSFGFSDAELSTGWFYVDDALLLSDLFNSLVSSEEIVVAIDDISGVGDNYLDFKQGLDEELKSAELSPVASAAVSVSAPHNMIIMLLGLFTMIFTYSARRK